MTRSTLLAAIRGTRIDYTTAPVGQAVVMLAVPMVMEMAMESIFAVADVFWVAHLGADAVATVGLTESMMTMIYTAAMGLSIGATALVARRTGEHDDEGAARAAGQSIVLGLLIAAAIAILAAPFAPALLRLMGATDSVVRTGSGFTTLMLAGNATVLLLFLQNAVFRGAGDAAVAMRVLILGNVLNIVLGPCFIFGIGPFPELGVTGAAVATNTGRGTAVLYQFYPADPRARARAPGAATPSPGRVDDAHRAEAVGIRHVPDPHRHCQLRRPDPHPVDIRQRRARRLHHRHPHHPLCAAARVRHQQRRGHHGRPEPGREAAGPGRTRRVDGRRSTT